MKKTYFLDSNIFLQCKELKTLPWEDLFDNNQELLLLIPRGAIKEIDNFKSQGNGRRSKKARTASTYIRSLITAANNLEIKKNVFIGLTKRKELDVFPKEAGLNLSRMDDFILQDIISYRKSHSDEQATLLSDDSLLLSSAIEYEVPVFPIPGSWLLDVEPDDKDKQIQALGKRLTELEEKSPIISLELSSSETLSTHALEYDYIHYPELTDEQAITLTELVVNKYPLPPDRSFSESLDYYPPTSEEIKLYKEVVYDNWTLDVMKAIKAIPKYLSTLQEPFDINLMINNRGQVSAENVILEISVSENMKLFFSENDPIELHSWRIPKWPTPPKGRAKSTLARMNESFRQTAQRDLNLFHPNMYNNTLVNLARDKNTFYWRDNEPSVLSDSWERVCAEFRHQSKSELMPIKLIVKYNYRQTEGGLLSCVFSASNLPDPIKLSKPVKFKVGVADSFSSSETLIQKLIK